jgi:oxygen-independent coproporphyrinogen-3 oxidase
VDTYLTAITKEVELLARTPAVGGRPLDFVYFGGGTPSYLSADQLRRLMTGVRNLMPWDQAREVAFECEPGTLQRHKLEALRELGVTRLSLGVENFKPEILQYNGRAHLEDEIYRAFGWARELGFDQINIDLIAGMVGEDWANWREVVAKTVALAPDCVTVYQMELPYNTVFSKELKMVGHDEPSLAVADWPTKRAWVRYAFDRFEEAGYAVTSATTVMKDPDRTKFVYRDALWTGADMFGTGVASFGHLNGVHMQNLDTWETYVAALDRGELPLGRALPISDHQRLIRETVLQLKTGRLDPAYFRRKFGADLRTAFADPLAHLEAAGILDPGTADITVTPRGLMEIDRHLPLFFEPQYRSVRYT